MVVEGKGNEWLLKERKRTVVNGYDKQWLLKRKKKNGSLKDRKRMAVLKAKERSGC